MPHTVAASRERFHVAAAAHGWAVEHDDDEVVEYRKGRRHVTVQFAVGSHGDRPSAASTAGRTWAGRGHSGPLIDWVLAALAR